MNKEHSLIKARGLLNCLRLWSLNLPTVSFRVPVELSSLSSLYGEGANVIQDKRFLLALLSIFQPIGVIVCSAIAYGFIPNYICEPDFTSADRLPSCRIGSFYGITEPGQPCCRKQDNMGWRYLMYTLGGVTLLVFFLRFVVFTMYESPKFLVYRGKDAKAADVLQKISRVNKRVCSVTLESFEALERDHNSMHSARSRGGAVLGSGAMQQKATMGEKLRLELSRYGMLFAGWQMTRLTILTWLTYICDFWGFTVAGKLLLENGHSCPASTAY